MLISNSPYIAALAVFVAGYRVRCLDEQVW